MIPELAFKSIWPPRIGFPTNGPANTSLPLGTQHLNIDAMTVGKCHIWHPSPLKGEIMYIQMHVYCMKTAGDDQMKRE